MAFIKKSIVMFFLCLLLFSLVGCADMKTDSLNKQAPLDSPPDFKISVSLPTLKVYCQDQSIDAKRGTYSWTNDGTGTSIDADLGPPPELVRDLTPLNVPPKFSLTLSFSDKPASIAVNIWKDNEPIKQSVIDDKIVVPEFEGPVIYEVIGTWKEGVVYYAFLVNVD